MRFNLFQWGVVHGLAWVVCLADGWILHNHVLFGIGLFFLFYSLWRMTMKTPEDEEFERIEREIAMRTCQVCRLRPAEVQGKNSNDGIQWRCQICHDLKNCGGFTKEKQ